MFFIEYRILNVWLSISWFVGVYNDNGRNIIKYVLLVMCYFFLNVECKEKRLVLYCEKFFRYISKY